MTIEKPNQSEEKASLRVQMAEKRARVSEKETRSRAACAHITAFLDKKNFQCAGLYYPIRSEISPLAVLDWCATRNKPTALPALISREKMVFRHWHSGDDLIKEKLGTSAPHADNPECIPDLYIVPMLAFNERGYRLGYGGGFYDRALASLKQHNKPCFAIGIAFEEQFCPSLPYQGHDIALDAIFTEQQGRFFNTGKKP